MQPHQRRVVDEKAELDKKIEALRVFIVENPFFGNLDSEEQARLKAQHEVMMQYSSILGDRIAAF